SWVAGTAAASRDGRAARPRCRWRLCRQAACEDAGPLPGGAVYVAAAGTAAEAAGGPGGAGGGRAVDRAERRRQRPGELSAEQLQPGQPGADPGLSPPRGAAGGAGEMLARVRGGEGQATGRAVVQNAQTRRGPGVAGAAEGSATAHEESSAAIVRRDAGLPGEPQAQNEVSGIPQERVVHRIRAGRERLQDGGRP